MNQTTYKQNLDYAIKEIKNLPLHKLDSDTKLLKQAFDILYEKDIFSITYNVVIRRFRCTLR